MVSKIKLGFEKGLRLGIEVDSKQSGCLGSGCPISGRYCRKWGFQLPLDLNTARAAYPALITPPASSAAANI